MLVCLNEKNEEKVKILKEKYATSNSYYVVVEKRNNEELNNNIRSSSNYYSVILQTEDLEEPIYLFGSFK